MRCGEGVYSYIGNGEVIFVLLLMRVGGFLTVCSREVVSVWLFLMSDVWGVSNSVGIARVASVRVEGWWEGVSGSVGSL